jgi:hypothetical protein
MYSEYREYVRQFRRNKGTPLSYREYLIRRLVNQQQSSQRITHSLKLQSL